MKSLLLLPDGIGIRNFILTQFIDQMIKMGSVIVWHAVPEELIQPFTGRWNGKVKWQQLPFHREGQSAFVLRRAKQLAQLMWQEEPGTEVVLDAMLARTAKGLYGLRNRVIVALARSFSHKQDQVTSLDRYHAWVVEHNRYFSDYVQYLEHEKPDVVFCSQQRSEIGVPAMLAARKLGIPTATFIYSWDNLPKGRMAVHADYFLVWSQHMKDEMRQYYPDVSEERIFIIGTPQFEHYFNPVLIQPREQFLAQTGLNPARPVVCFSGDDLTTSPFDPDYLADLAEALRPVPEEQRPQILFRRSPTDVSGRYNAVLQRYPEIVVSEPLWVTFTNNEWSKVVPTEADAELLVNVVRHCDLVVNVGSTMAVDFAILGKPAVYLAYNPASWETTCPWSIEKVYRYPHFNHLPNFNPVYWARSKNELLEKVMHAIDHPEELEAARRAWIEFLVKTPLDEASQRCVDAIQKITGK